MPASARSERAVPAVPGRRFDGLVAVVTGSAWGMGRRHAERFAAEGARVVVADLQGDLAEEVAAELPEAIAVRCDVSDAADTERMAAEAVSAFGQIDILVNNAGGALFPERPFWEIGEADWDRTLNLNLKGLWLCTCAVLPSMRQSGRGKVVNIASTAAVQAIWGRAAYGASKGAVVALTKTMACEVGPFGITVNAVAPGLVEVPHPKKSFSPEDYERMKAQALESQAIKRVSQMDDISDAVLFFASSESDLITGQLMVVNGGSESHGPVPVRSD
jgi:3-oxoacyl-[acyl-carrier protein] reductase